ncbi:MAG: hypothetical protein NUV54_03285, partial [Candidatus Taylorbacteria bacterium]|nr:hypothetical protein [Candidatus Taylorbacteria bacterium]
MSYIQQFNRLSETVNGLPPQVLSRIGDTNVVFIIESISDSFGLTMYTIGEVCELVRQIITKEREPKDFEAGLLEKLDEDNHEKIPQLVSLMSEKVFSKLLPALGIKIPIEFAVKVGELNVEGLEVAKIESARPAPFTKTESSAQTSYSSTSVPPPVIRGALFSGVSAPPPHNLPTGKTPFFHQGSNTPSAPTPVAPAERPLMEMAHGQVSAHPLESLLRMLNNKVSDKELAKQFEKLPIKLKEALRSVDSARKIIDIGRKNGLHVDQIGELGAETGMVILGFSRPNQFVSQLRRRLDLPEDKLKTVAEEVNTEVFVKIREALKQIHGEDVAPSTPIPIKPAVQAQKTEDMWPSAPPTKNIESENMPDKASILRDIENPKPLWFRDPALKTPPPVP